MITEPQLLLVGTVATVGVLHTMVPDHWLLITVVARQRGRSKRQMAQAALQAGTGHVLSTLDCRGRVDRRRYAAARFGRLIDTLSSIASLLSGCGSRFPPGTECIIMGITMIIMAMQTGDGAVAYHPGTSERN